MCSSSQRGPALHASIHPYVRIKTIDMLTLILTTDYTRAEPPVSQRLPNQLCKVYADIYIYIYMLLTYIMQCRVCCVLTEGMQLRCDGVWTIYSTSRKARLCLQQVILGKSLATIHVYSMPLVVTHYCYVNFLTLDGQLVTGR